MNEVNNPYDDCTVEDEPAFKNKFRLLKQKVRRAFSGVERASNNPQLQAIGLTEKSELFVALHHGWTAKDIVRVATTLQTFFSLTPDTALSWNSFPWKDESLKSFTAADVNEELLQSYADKLPVYAQSKEYEAQSLANGIVGINRFMLQISQGSIDSLQTIPSFELINFLEPEWFNVVCESVQTTPEEYETSIAPLTADIEALLAPYLKDKEIDTPDGIWRHSKTILRDKDSLEDQMMHLTIVEKDGQAKLQISFKLTSVCLKENQEKIAGLSRVRRADAPETEAERLAKLKEKLDTLGDFCSNCRRYHFYGDSTEQEHITELVKIGFTAEEYATLITKLRSGWSSSKAGKFVSFTSTPTAKRTLNAAQTYDVEATQQITVSDDVLVSVFDSQSEAAGYTGTMHFDIKLDDDATAESVTTKLAIIMKMMGIQDTLSPVTPESRRTLAVNRYKWNRKTHMLFPEMAIRLEYRAITKDYGTFVEPGFHEKLEKKGLKYLFSDHRSNRGAAGLFRLGLLSSNERRRLGLIRGGWSVGRDIETGGSDYAFARVMSSKSSDYREISNRALWDTSTMDRTDYFSCDHDNYGGTSGEVFDKRRSPTAFVRREMKRGYSLNNEVCFKKAIGADKLVLLVVSEKDQKMAILEELAKRGTTHHRGVPVEDCIFFVHGYDDYDEASDKHFLRGNDMIQAAYDQLRERYKQIEAQQIELD